MGISAELFLCIIIVKCDRCCTLRHWVALEFWWRREGDVCARARAVVNTCRDYLSAFITPPTPPAALYVKIRVFLNTTTTLLLKTKESCHLIAIVHQENRIPFRIYNFLAYY